jgi:hypothetical protein
MESMPWFIKGDDGKFYAGGPPEEETSWVEGRKGALAFGSEKAATDRIDRLGISATAEGF